MQQTFYAQRISLGSPVIFASSHKSVLGSKPTRSVRLVYNIWLALFETETIFARQVFVFSIHPFKVAGHEDLFSTC